MALLDSLGWQPVWQTLQGGLGGLAEQLLNVRSGAQLQSVASKAFLTADPLVSALAAALLLSALVWLLSLPTNNHSWVDKTWSVLPVVYLWHFALHDHLSAGASYGATVVHPRLLAMAALATLWGARLTYNFARKGGYAWSGEDYRWPVVRARLHPALFQVVNLTFIALYQNLLLLSIAAPGYVAWQHLGTPWGSLDSLAAALCLGCIIMETVADQQQWTFQTAKYARMAAGKRLTGEYAKGFLTSGLFRYSRHPNFFAEQALWFGMYLFSVAASGNWLNWSLGGAVQLALLFQGSTLLTERITQQKYPAYAAYQATTSRLLPWFPPGGRQAKPAPPLPTRVQPKRISTRGNPEEALAAAAAAAAEDAVAAAQAAREQAAAAKEQSVEEEEMAAPVQETPAKRPRGRPRKTPMAPATAPADMAAATTAAAAAAKAGRGRRPAAKAQESGAEEEGEEEAAPGKTPSARRGRGRPAGTKTPAAKAAAAAPAQEAGPATLLRQSSRLRSKAVKA